MSNKSHYFYNITRKIILQFTDLFNDIIVARYDDNDNITKYIKVPVKFAPKTKQWYWTELRNNKDRRDQVFPIISIDLDNIEYASDRQMNRNIKIAAINDGTDIKTYYNPVPYDLTFKVQVATEYFIDSMQIIEQVLPFFTPQTFIRITVPELDITSINPTQIDGADNLELRVVYEGSQNDMPIELDEAGYRILLWTHTFKVHGYMFSPIKNSKSIHRIIQSYYSTDESWNNRLSDINNQYNEVGSATIQGVTSATEIPTDGTHIDDTIRELSKYEHFD